MHPIQKAKKIKAISQKATPPTENESTFRVRSIAWIGGIIPNSQTQHHENSVDFCQNMLKNAAKCYTYPDIALT